MNFLYLIIIIFAITNLLRYPINKKKLGTCIKQDKKELPLNWRDYISVAFIICSIIMGLGGAKLFLSYLLITFAIFSIRISMRFYAANSGLYEKGLILSRGIMTWDKIHSIKVIDEHRAEILTMKGIAFDIKTGYKIDLLIENFKKVKE